jgi:hypothetical protein
LGCHRLGCDTSCCDPCATTGTSRCN